jgi:hypothetical protein
MKVIKAINIYTKKKQRKVYIIDSFKDLNEFDFVKAIPENAIGVEITSKMSNGSRTLEIDYVLESITDNFKKGELYE